MNLLVLSASQTKKDIIRKGFQLLGLPPRSAFAAAANPSNRTSLSEPDSVVYVLLLNNAASASKTAAGNGGNGSGSSSSVLYPRLTEGVFKLVGDVYTEAEREKLPDVRFVCSNLRKNTAASLSGGSAAGAAWRDVEVKAAMRFANIVCDADVCGTELELYSYLDEFFHEESKIGSVSHQFRAAAGELRVSFLRP